LSSEVGTGRQGRARRGHAQPNRRDGGSAHCLEKETAQTGRGAVALLASLAQRRLGRALRFTLGHTASQRLDLGSYPKKLRLDTRRGIPSRERHTSIEASGEEKQHQGRDATIAHGLGSAR
jgi:hypothetical protein